MVGPESFVFEELLGLSLASTTRTRAPAAQRSSVLLFQVRSSRFRLGRNEIHGFGDKIQGPIFGLFVQLADIFAKHSDADEQIASDNAEGDD